MNKYIVLGLGMALYFSQNLFASEARYRVSHSQARVYSAPSEKSVTKMKLKNGKKIISTGKTKGDWIELKTKSGKSLWMKQSDLERIDSVTEDDLAEVSEERSQSQTAHSKKDDYAKFQYDLGGSVGGSGGESYYEMHLGLDYFILRWLVWRNAPFYRLPSNSVALYGLDSSLQGRHQFNLSQDIAPHFNLGAGYRLATQGSSVPFVEAGLGCAVKKINIGASVKYLLYSAVGDGRVNEKIYTINFSGSGAF